MQLIRMDIKSVIVGGGSLASAIVLQPRSSAAGAQMLQLPIRVGISEASAIGAAMHDVQSERPLTHVLFKNTLEKMGIRVTCVSITRVEGEVFYAAIDLAGIGDTHFTVDARPSDAIALALRFNTSILVSEDVLQAAGIPDFQAIQADEEEREFDGFRDFVSKLNADDFDSL